MSFISGLSKTTLEVAAIIGAVCTIVPAGIWLYNHSKRAIGLLSSISKEQRELRNTMEEVLHDLHYLRQREDAFLEHHVCGMFICDLDGNNSWVNSTYSRFCKAGKDELVGKGWRNFFSPEDLAIYDQTWIPAFRDRREIGVEATIQPRGEKVGVKVLVRLTKILDFGGGVNQYMGQIILKTPGMTVQQQLGLPGL